MESFTKASSDLKENNAGKIEDKGPFSTEAVGEDTQSQCTDRSEEEGKGNRSGNLVCVSCCHSAEKRNGKPVDSKRNSEEVFSR